MTNRERMKAILNYQPVDRIPCISFGYWYETLLKWVAEGHITQELCDSYFAGIAPGAEPAQHELMRRLGFDFNWCTYINTNMELCPPFERLILREEADGSLVQRDTNGLITRVKPGLVSIPAEIGTTLTDRAAWEELYLPKLKFSPERIPMDAVEAARRESETRDTPLGLYCGSLYGFMRNLLGVEELSYLQVDDEALYAEIIDTIAELCYQEMVWMLDSGIQFDYAHFWEDICFKNGPLVHPSVFAQFVGPHYKRMTDELKRRGIDIVSLDCDGQIDHLLPIWLENGVNTMFPIEVGTWEASIRPWREKYGKNLRGVGGMDKRVFAQDRKAIDREIDRLRGLVELGGYIPCPDHRIAPDAEYANVAYYCEKFHKVFD